MGVIFGKNRHKRLEEETPDIEISNDRTLTSPSVYPCPANVNAGVQAPPLQYDKRHRRETKEIKKKDGVIAQLTEKIQNLKEEKEKLIFRLSSMASSKMTDNNPDITDLSDENRPTKLAEQYTQLYDNEWTDAFDALVENCQKSEEEAIAVLRDSFLKIYEICHQFADQQLAKVKEALATFEGTDEPSMEIIKILKDSRKKHHKLHLKRLKQFKTDELSKVLSYVDLGDVTEQDKSPFINFLSKCFTITWLMSIQDPSVYVDPQVDKKGKRFDKNLYREFTVSGDRISYIVWPTLYLYKGGAVLAKGTAQGQNKKKKSKLNVAHDGDSTDELVSMPDTGELALEVLTNSQTPEEESVTHVSNGTSATTRNDTTTATSPSTSCTVTQQSPNRARKQTKKSKKKKGKH